jgi:hypothetical protein
VQGGEDEGVTERVELPGRWWAGVDAPQIRASSGKTARYSGGRVLPRRPLGHPE